MNSVPNSWKKLKNSKNYQYVRPVSELIKMFLDKKTEWDPNSFFLSNEEIARREAKRIVCEIIPEFYEPYPGQPVSIKIKRTIIQNEMVQKYFPFKRKYGHRLGWKGFDKKIIKEVIIPENYIFPTGFSKQDVIEDHKFKYQIIELAEKFQETKINVELKLRDLNNSKLDIHFDPLLYKKTLLRKNLKEIEFSLSTLDKVKYIFNLLFSALIQDFLEILPILKMILKNLPKILINTFMWCIVIFFITQLINFCIRCIFYISKFIRNKTLNFQKFR